MRVLLVASSVTDNPLGRVHSNWLAARSAGMGVRVLVPPDAGDLWAPVRNDEPFIDSFTSDVGAAARWADVAVAHKPLSTSYGVARRLRKRFGVPLVLDIDDPDFEGLYGEGVRDQVANIRTSVSRRQLRHVARFASAGYYRFLARGERHLAISNPAISTWYGPGTVVPHARVVPPLTDTSGSEDRPLDIAFVGTVRPHKGVELLRDAVASVEGFRLTITAELPDDAQANEHWVGQTGLAEGRRIVAASDIVGIMSQPTVYGRGQLPAKLIDAMLAGKAIVASRLPPIEWALGDAGLLVEPGDDRGLARALEQLRDDAPTRRALGERARLRAIDLFGCDAVGASFAAVCRAALAGPGRSGRGVEVREDGSR